MRFGHIYLFYFVVLTVSLIAALSHFSPKINPDTANENVEKRASVFLNSFLSIYRADQSTLNLETQKLVESPINNKILLFDVKGELGKDKKIQFFGKNGVVHKNQHFLKLNDEIELTNEQSKTVSDYLFLDYQKNEMNLSGNVKSYFSLKDQNITINSNSMSMDKVTGKTTYKEMVKGNILSAKKVGVDNIKFKSNLLIYDDLNQVINLEGNAYIHRGKSEIFALNGIIWLENFGEGVKYFAMNDDVRLNDSFVNEAGKKMTRMSFSEKLEGFSLEKKIILSGYPQVKQDRDIIKGNKMIIREDEEVIEIINTNSQFNLEKGSMDE